MMIINLITFQFKLLKIWSKKKNVYRPTYFFVNWNSFSVKRQTRDKLCSAWHLNSHAFENFCWAMAAVSENYKIVSRKLTVSWQRLSITSAPVFLEWCGLQLVLLNFCNSIRAYRFCYRSITASCYCQTEYQREEFTEMHSIIG